MCRHLPDNRSGRLANLVRLEEILADLNLCQIYGLAQMKKLPDLPEFCLLPGLSGRSCG